MLRAGVELVALPGQQQREVLDRLLVAAHRHGVELRCCCESGLVGHRASTAAKVEVRKVRRWGLGKVPWHAIARICGQYGIVWLF